MTRVRHGDAGEGAWHGRLVAVRTALRSALWPIPALSVLIAIVLGVGLRYVDVAWHASGSEPTTLLFGGDGSAARSILSAIATSLAAIVSLLFSLTIVTLQLASTQYSPRLLQTFSRDRVVQVCLATLLGSFVYSLIVLRNVRSPSDSIGGDLVPRLSVTVAVVLTLASVAALVVFIGHQVTELRVETMMREVHSEASRTLSRLRDIRRSGGSDDTLPEAPDGALQVNALSNGFFQDLDVVRLRARLAELHAVVLLEARPGDPVIMATPIARAWPDTAGGKIDADAVAAALEGSIVVGFERTDARDPSYGLRKLADIAIRALSPGINDPTTAVHALSHISALFGEAGEVDSWHQPVRDDEGRVRLILRSWDYSELLDLALLQIYHYGGQDPAVTDRLFQVLTELAWRASTALQRDTLSRHCRLLSDACLRDPPMGWSRDDVRDRGRALAARLAV